MKSLIGKKIGMTQIYDEKGKTVPVTVIQAGPCVVVDVKTVERDGYSAKNLRSKALDLLLVLLGMLFLYWGSHG